MTITVRETVAAVFLFLVLYIPLEAWSQDRLYIGDDSAMSDIALAKLAEVIPVERSPLQSADEGDRGGHSVILLRAGSDKDWLETHDIPVDDLKPEGFKFLRRSRELYVVGGDERGLTYGILDLRDQLRMGASLGEIEDKTENPRLGFRAVKFNLPWSSYRIGEPIFQHMQTVRDITFWEGYLDMMAENRLNALTLWNLHPFTFMVQPEKYPEATQFTGQEFEDWRTFWRALFRMAKERGIETYIVNWNIITSPGMTETHNVANYKDDLEWHYGFTPADTSPIIVDYMREVITQTINEYPNLTGVGVSLGERMNMPVEDALKWVEQTFVEGIRRANREVRFIHRAPFKVEPETARRYIESYDDFSSPIIMEFKFNWSHGHSSPNLSITHGGKVRDQYWNPTPSNYQMAWMMRNEDFIMLNWGNTDFIREHMAVNSAEDYVAGYFIGSETYIPAREFRMHPETQYDWQYAYEKDWQFYSFWGRLMYDPELPDEYFISQFEHRYGEDVGGLLFEALQLGSEMPLELSSFYQGTWDFTLYSEGFLNGGQVYRNYKEAGEAFIRVDEMIKHPTLDARYLNVDTFVNRILSGETIQGREVTPLEIAAKMEANAGRIMDLVGKMDGRAVRNRDNFVVEQKDVEAWAQLSLYFADKLTAAVYLDEAIKTGSSALQQKAIASLEAAAEHWQGLIDATRQYQDVSLLHIRSHKFSWEMYYTQVLKDIEIAREAL